MGIELGPAWEPPKQTTTPTNGCCETHYGCDFAVDKAAHDCKNPHCQRAGCHSQEPQQEGWIEKKVEEFFKQLYYAAEKRKPYDLSEEWFRTALTEAYNLGKKETEYDIATFGAEARKKGFEDGIRSERERILAALPAPDRFDDTRIAKSVLDEIRAIISGL